MSATSPLISVIIPCYNQGRYLSDCISSITANTSVDLEILIINDGSSEQETLEILKSLPSQYSALNINIISQSNMGLSAARNVGIAAANGKYIQLLDADDAVTSNKFSKQLKYFEQHPNYSVVISDYFFALEFLDLLTPSKNTIGSFDLSPKSFLLHWEKGLSIPIHCGLFLASALKKYPFPQDFRAKEDWIFWTRFSVANKLFYHSDRMAIYRLQSLSMTRNYRQMALQWLEAQTFLLCEFGNLLSKEELFKEIKNNSKHINDFYLEPMTSNKYFLRSLIIRWLRKAPWLYRLVIQWRLALKEP